MSYFNIDHPEGDSNKNTNNVRVVKETSRRNGLRFYIEDMS